MNFLAILRLLLYALSVGASVQGVATFDPETGTIDFAPFTIDSLITGVAGIVAMVALWFGWGKK
jgi:uncharacterized membrane protein